MSLKEMNLGEEGKEFISAWFRRGAGLSGKIAMQLERGGEVFAPLPPETRRERALQFEAGGLLSWRDTCMWFERELERLSGRTANGSLVFEDIGFTSQDVVGEKYDGLFFDDQSSVYYVLGPRDINEAAISDTILRLKSFFLVAIFCNFSFSAAGVPTTRILDETLIDGMANNAQEVFVSAYDREGLVVWRKA